MYPHICIPALSSASADDQNGRDTYMKMKIHT